MKLTDLISIEDLEKAAKLDPVNDPIAKAIAEETMERTKAYAPIFAAFGAAIASRSFVMGLEVDPRIIASAMLSAFIVIDVTLQQKTGGNVQ